jgi:hypothetical protein
VPQNLYACLVHESASCVLDLVRNLRYHDRTSDILLYNGGRSSNVFSSCSCLACYGATIVPNPKSLRWGRLHDFAVDCMRFALKSGSFSTLTIVDSDQLLIRSCYPDFVQSHLASVPGVGMLGKFGVSQPITSDRAPVLTAWREIDLWRPFLKRFPSGMEKFPMWTFWPSTIFTEEAARAIVHWFDHDDDFKAILIRTRILASEEIILPTLTALLGFKVAKNPCSYDFVKYRASYTENEILQAFDQQNAYWVHPVERVHDDPIRSFIRERCSNYRGEHELGQTECVCRR